jgi:chromosome segregation ATPase
MAREATITSESVAAVANRIRAGGGRPTARAVREELGSGSMATVLKHLQVWQAAQGRQVDGPAVLPAALQRALVEFIGQEVAAATAPLESDLQAAQQANADIIAESERRALALEEAEREANLLRTEVAAVQGRLAQVSANLEDSHQAIQVERHAVEVARTELAKAKVRLEGLLSLESDLERLRAALEAERDARAAAEKAAAVAEAKLEKTEGQVADLEKRLAKAEELARVAGQDAAKLQGQLVGSRSTPK